jgi:hypothetical protein
LGPMGAIRDPYFEIVLLFPKACKVNVFTRPLMSVEDS